MQQALSTGERFTIPKMKDLLDKKTSIKSKPKTDTNESEADSKIDALLDE